MRTWLPGSGLPNNPPDGDGQERVWTVSACACRIWDDVPQLVATVGDECLSCGTIIKRIEVVPLAALQAERERAERTAKDEEQTYSDLEAAYLAAEKKAEELEADYHRAEEALAHEAAEVERLREALERIAHGASHFFHAQDLARNALETAQVAPPQEGKRHRSDWTDEEVAHEPYGPQEGCPHGCEDGWIVHPQSEFDRTHGESRRWHDPCPIHASSQEGKDE